MLTITSITIYPIKSFGGISLETAEVTTRGLRYDRWWMLVDEQGVFVSQRSEPALALFHTAISGSELRVYHAHVPGDVLRLALQPSEGETIPVTIWEDKCMAIGVDSDADAWFTQKLRKKVRLVYMPEHVNRYVDPDYAKLGETTGFSDGFPVLLIGKSSLEDLNSRLQYPVPMDRFRPNLVFSGGYPFQEDAFREIQMNELKFLVVKPCARCIMTTIDQKTGVGGKEPLNTLATYRTKNNKVLFGQNLLVSHGGILHTGAELSVIR